ncbi:FmdB family zinc ribbon protein [Nonomuraea endophytica]|uniref:Putative FmdB family regulatory protein n=1 Tax=Nonomuraea endophytica TaxID=714136 RepID=A0A7W8A713_9ACTN|nr:FmdB family zinc ribbon protein [Nonomuraea endophytica]MBB5080699.1 putative FmdB family regulatory protein [Nonomuraea endophytica]
MPTYQYVCNDCGQPLEVVQKFSDDALTVCPNCEGKLRKVFSAAAIVFKGSGFYKTDNRSSSTSATTTPASSTPEKTAAPSTSSSSSEKSSTPAAASS